ncbi:MAG: hypothetical protein ACOX8V_00475 [Thermoleophilia bacterium]|jgi:nitrate/nitrite transporter NarK
METGSKGEGALGTVLISVAIGVVLAVVYQLVSMRLQRWASHQRFPIGEVITIIGAVVRLGVLIGILVVLGIWTSLSVLAVCLAFLVVFSVLTGVWLFAMSKRRGSPPSAGASSVLF